MALDADSLDALAGKDRYQRIEAVLALGSSGEAAALPHLQPLLTDPDGLVSTSALFASWQLSGELPPLEPALAALASSDEEQVQTAVQVLTRIGDALLPELQSRLAAQSPYSTEILQLLGDIGGQQALQLLHQAAQSDHADIAAVARGVIDDWEE